MDSKMDLIATLTAARHRQRRSRADVGGAIGVSHSAVRHWEKGERTPYRERVQAWCVYLGVPYPAKANEWFQPTPDLVHGTQAGYVRCKRERGGKACGDCLAGNAAAVRAYRAGKREAA